MGHFTTIFGTKTDNVVLQFATSECRRYPKPTVERIDLVAVYGSLGVKGLSNKERTCEGTGQWQGNEGNCLARKTNSGIPRESVPRKCLSECMPQKMYLFHYFILFYFYTWDIPWYTKRKRCISILYHVKYSGQHNQCDIRAAHDGKVRCNTVEYTTAFLYSDWLYFLWHGIINNKIMSSRFLSRDSCAPSSTVAR